MWGSLVFGDDIHAMPARLHHDRAGLYHWIHKKSKVTPTLRNYYTRANPQDSPSYIANSTRAYHLLESGSHLTPATRFARTTRALPIA
jgi:hypothetical protein